MAEDNAMDHSHMRSIRTAIAAVALATLTNAVPIRGEFGFPLLVTTIILVIYSFVPTYIRS